MKSLLVFVSAFALILLTEASSSRSEYSKSDPSLEQILKKILSDPNFLSLSEQKKLNIIISIYQVLENYYSQRFGAYKEEKKTNKIS